MSFADNMKKLYVLLGLLLPAFVFNVLACNDSGHFKQEKSLKGGALAKQYCGSCHMVPDPAQLDKTTWLQYVLPKMGGLPGFKSLGFAGRYYEEAQAAMKLVEWNNLALYYYANAPVKLPAPPASYNIAKSTPLFQVETPPSPIASPATTMVSIQAGENSIMFGDGTTGMVYTLKQNILIDSFIAGIGLSAISKTEGKYQGVIDGSFTSFRREEGQACTLSARFANNNKLIGFIAAPCACYLLRC